MSRRHTSERAARLPSRTALLLAVTAAFVVMPNHVSFREPPAPAVMTTKVAQRGASPQSTSAKGDRLVEAEAGSRLGGLHLEPSKAEAHEVGGMLRKAFPTVNRGAKGDALGRKEGRRKTELGRLRADDIVGPALALGAEEAPKVVAAFAPVAGGVRLLGRQAAPVIAAPEPAVFIPSAPQVAPQASPEAGEGGAPENDKRLMRARAAVQAGGFPAASMRCLAEAVYFEARGESEEGQAAVAQVVINRVHSEHYPDTICDVVYQNRDWKNRCQFSFACDGHVDRIRNEEAWELAQRVARDVGEGRTWLSEVAFSTHYHATYVKPRWIRDMVKTDKIGRHIFYRVRWWEQPTGDEDFSVQPASAKAAAAGEPVGAQNP